MTYQDYGYYAAPDHTFNTPPSDAATMPAGRVYAEGGTVNPYTRFYPKKAAQREDMERELALSSRLDRGAPSYWRRMPNDYEDIYRPAVGALSDEWSRFTDRHHGNPATYAAEALARLDSLYGARDTEIPRGTVTDALRQVTSHLNPIQDTYQQEHPGWGSRLSDAALSVANTMPGNALAARGIKAGTAVALPVLGALAGMAGQELPSWLGYQKGGEVASSLRRIAKQFGSAQADRATRAADEGLLDRYSARGIMDTFDPRKSGLYASMPPEDFQNYATRLPQAALDKVPYPRWSSMAPASARRGMSREDLTLDNYLQGLMGHIDEKGLSEAPTMWMYRNPNDLTAVEGHEGRHRMMAMDRMGDRNALLRINPANSGELLRPSEGSDSQAMVERLLSKYFPRGGSTIIAPEDLATGFPRAPRALYAQPFQEGGKVASKLSKVARELASRIREPDSGFTWQPNTGAQPDKGYAVSIYPERGRVFDSAHIDPSVLTEYARENADLLSDPTHHFGAWHDPATGKAHFDISVVHPEERDAEALARRFNQISYFDFDKMRSVEPDYSEVVPTFAEGDLVAKGVRQMAKSWRTRAAEAASEQAVPEVNTRLQTVANPRRMSYPGIYKDPRDLTAEAKARLIADPGSSGAMSRLFGVTRQDLDALAQENRAFDIRPFLEAPPFELSGHAATSKDVLVPRNAQRLQNELDEALQDPDLRATRSWYEMSPLWKRMTQLGMSPQDQRAFNTRVGVMSAGSDPETEINRGIFANYLGHRGELEDFVRYGVVPERARGQDFPPAMAGMRGHSYHNTSQVPNLLDFEATGRLWSDAHKVPTYVAATDPLLPVSNRPIADSHFSRFLGYPDVATAKTAAVREGPVSPTEYSDLVPWWNSKVAEKMDLRPRDAQALLWNVGGPQTGVRYIGPSKLEMIANYMDESARRLGVSPETARDLILTGQSSGFPHRMPSLGVPREALEDVPLLGPRGHGFAEGGSVDDDYLGYAVQNYARGGSVDDDMLAYHVMNYDEGGPVRGYFSR